MVAFKLSVLALTAVNAITALAQAQDALKVEELDEIPGDVPLTGGAEVPLPGDSQRVLNVQITTSFPQSEIFGVKLVNGHATRAVLDIVNHEAGPVSLAVVGGTLMSPRDRPGAPDPPVVVRNLTAQRYGLSIPAGEKESVTYAFATELHPQDLTLNIAAVLQGADGGVFSRIVFNDTVSVVEAPISIFDPQIIFLYIFLAAAFGGTCYFIYSTWITTLFPQKRRGTGKGGERAKRSSAGTKRVDPAEQVAVTGADGPAVTTSATSYDESWIPAGHLKRPEAKRVGSGRPKSRAA